ncbi:DUF3683 domain-containing protein [Desulfogranum mediterraneum]|uniref:DUF3683 domain-containing protein n=1 Tax=Desulfogranum mediterraneum TaxID=160661 RepID=UPI0003F7472C|nr:DUF3683 domain-containing protein [Desulfogranum mediterraneum]
MNINNYREIPYNFTSADDRLIINHLFGAEVWSDLEELRSQRITGRSARLVMRFMGDLFILHRNPFLRQELIDSKKRRHNFFDTAEKDLSIIENTAKHATALESSRNQKVLNLVHLCTDRLKALRREISGAKARREQIKKQLGSIIGRDNVCFDPFSLISHATDATDWRLYLPLAILRPDQESQVAPLMRAVEELGLHIIPRGGGTGLTGGSVPVKGNCVIINTEKLNRIFPVSYQQLSDDAAEKVPVLKLEAGVITQDAMAAAEEQGLVFATDPTSAWASTIGGNIAENAGGKTAVLWGTAIDNILSYKIAMPGAELFTVRRVNHPLRKILPEDLVCYEVLNSRQQPVRQIELRGDEIRKKGLWKDITNKALKGLPGVQKEGTDGVITSAEFVLYQAYEEKQTFCLEFFGQDMDEASRVIVEISEEFTNHQGQEALMALEHFDEEYIRAINYKFKAARSESPKAVLLIDMVGHDQEQINRGRERLVKLLDPYVNTETFIARDNEEAVRFWRDRKRLGAIAARTNAFKLNEDIVLPLPALAEFARFVDAYNIEEDIYNKQCFVRSTLEYLKTAEPIEDPDWLEAKKPKAEELCRETLARLELRTTESVRHHAYINQLLADLLELFRGYSRVSANIERTYEQVRTKRIVIATHMHAGDGNVHVNIPVFSNDRAMMKRAEKTAEDIMAKAVELDGVVSGEHGIGITKMKFLDAERVEELNRYRREVDPKGLMNPGKLDDPQIIDKVFTPSFNLLELEARILQYGSLEALSAKISRCIRCGKCKADCCVFFPGTNLFFHPRNKNLVIGALIEALLYDIQRSRFPRFNQLKYLEEVADHCTMCHKCLSPCPVDIDTAEVSILEREILRDFGYKHSPPQTRMSLFYLKNRNKYFNAFFRKTVVEWGAGLQRQASQLLHRLPALAEKRWPPLELLRSEMAPASKTTLRDILPPTASSETLLIHPPEESEKTIFYFPGCGSERLYAEISMASIYILLKNRVRIVLPPSFLCCGFPARVNAKKKMHAELSLRNTIILSQIRDMLGYINFDAFVISCGTCKEALAEMGVEEIFGCRISDVSRFTLDNQIQPLDLQDQPHCLYHAPCHDSLEGGGAAMIQAALSARVTPVPNCCSEAGTMALSRPDISGAMLQRKGEAMEQALAMNTATEILTNCPSCISGLSRNQAKGARPVHLAEKLALTMGGTNWQEELKTLLNKIEVVTF